MRIRSGFARLFPDGAEYAYQIEDRLDHHLSIHFMNTVSTNTLLLTLKAFEVARMLFSLFNSQKLELMY